MREGKEMEGEGEERGEGEGKGREGRRKGGREGRRGRGGERQEENRKGKGEVTTPLTYHCNTSTYTQAQAPPIFLSLQEHTAGHKKVSPLLLSLDKLLP